MAVAGPRARGPSWAGIVLRIAIAVFALGWTFTMASPGEVLRALSAVPLTGLLGALLAYLGASFLAAVRWGLILSAYGADRIPLGVRLNLTLVAIFQNTFLPGAIVGDLARSHLSRKAFRGGAGAYVVVFLDRALGLTGLLVLCSVLQLLRPIEGMVALQPLAVLALVGAAGLASVPFVAHRIAPLAPEPARSLLEKMPVVVRPALLFAALGIAVLIQALLALSAHSVIGALAPEVPLTTSMVVVPLALIAVYFPGTVGGLGVREVAFITLFAPVGVGAATATAASFGLYGAQALTGLVGGLLQVTVPVEVEAPPEG